MRTCQAHLFLGTFWQVLAEYESIVIEIQKWKGLRLKKKKRKKTAECLIFAKKLSSEHNGFFSKHLLSLSREFWVLRYVNGFSLKRVQWEASFPLGPSAVGQGSWLLIPPGHERMWLWGRLWRTNLRHSGGLTHLPSVPGQHLIPKKRKGTVYKLLNGRGEEQLPTTNRFHWSSIAAGRGPQSRCAPLCLPIRVVNIIKTIRECLTAEAQHWRWRHCRGRGEEAWNSHLQGTPRAWSRERNKQQDGLQSTPLLPGLRNSPVARWANDLVFPGPLALLPLWYIEHPPPLECAASPWRSSRCSMTWSPRGFHIHALGARTQREPLHHSRCLLWCPNTCLEKQEDM